MDDGDNWKREAQFEALFKSFSAPSPAFDTATNAQLHSLYPLFAPTHLSRGRTIPTDPSRILAELDSRARSSKQGEMAEALMFFPLLMKEFAQPALVSAALTRLADLFRSGTNLVRYLVVEALQKCTTEVQIMPHPEEIAWRFRSVMSSNDPTARGLCLRVFCALAPLVANRVDVQHSCVKAMDSYDQTERHAALQAADSFCKISPEFCHLVLPSISHSLDNLNLSIDEKARIASLCRHMHADQTIFASARSTLISSLSSYPIPEFIPEALKTLTILVLNRLSGLQDHVDLLASYFDDVNSWCESVACSALDCMKMMATHAEHLCTIPSEVLHQIVEQSPHASIRIVALSILPHSTSPTIQHALMSTSNPAEASAAAQVLLRGYNYEPSYTNPASSIVAAMQRVPSPGLTSALVGCVEHDSAIADDVMRELMNIHKNDVENTVISNAIVRLAPFCKSSQFDLVTPATLAASMSTPTPMQGYMDCNANDRYKLAIHALNQGHYHVSVEIMEDMVTRLTPHSPASNWCSALLHIAKSERYLGESDISQAIDELWLADKSLTAGSTKFQNQIEFVKLRIDWLISAKSMQQILSLCGDLEEKPIGEEAKVTSFRFFRAQLKCVADDMEEIGRHYSAIDWLSDEWPKSILDIKARALCCRFMGWLLRRDRGVFDVDVTGHVLADRCHAILDQIASTTDEIGSVALLSACSILSCPVPWPAHFLRVRYPITGSVKISAMSEGESTHGWLHLTGNVEDHRIGRANSVLARRISVHLFGENGKIGSKKLELRDGKFDGSVFVNYKGAVSATMSIADSWGKIWRVVNQ